AGPRGSSAASTGSTPPAPPHRPSGSHSCVNSSPSGSIAHTALERTVLVFLSDRALSLEHLDLLHRTLRRSGHRLRRGLRDRSGIARSALILSGQCGDLSLRHELPGDRIPRRHRTIPAPTA